MTNSKSQSCTIIIPTYNNARVISRTLQALYAERVTPGWQVEVCVADDGSDDETVAALESYPHRWPCRIVRGPHVGAGGARNRALQQTAADVIFFLGADILLRPGALAAHLTFHSTYGEENYAALGFVQWDPRLHPSPLMEWLVHGGPQNNFDDVLGVRWADARHYFYGSHLSLKRSLLAQHAFAPDFTEYGWEDLELGRRLADRGLQLAVLAEARALHCHRYLVRDVIKRQYFVGRGLMRYQALYPELPLLPPRSSFGRIKRLLASLVFLRYLVRLYVWWRPHNTYPRLFSFLCTEALRRGLRSAGGHV